MASISPSPLEWYPVAAASSESARTPLGRWKHAAVVASDGTLYVHGGRCGSQALRDLWRLRPAAGYSGAAEQVHLQHSVWEWEEVELGGALPPALEEHTMTAHREHLLIFGGCFGYTDCVDAPLWIVSLSFGLCRQWQPHGEVLHPEARRGHSAVMYKEAMHVFGGYVDLRGSCAQLWTFDLASESWHVAWSPSSHQGGGPSARHSHSAVLHDASMWVYGGMSDLSPCSDLWKWSFRIGQWCRIRPRGPSPPPLSNHAAVVVVTAGDASILLSGGEDSQVGLWLYHLQSDSWRSVMQTGQQPTRSEHHSMLLLPMPMPAALMPGVTRQPSCCSADSAYRSADTSRSGSCRYQYNWSDNNQHSHINATMVEHQLSEDIQLEDIDEQVEESSSMAFTNRCLSVTSSWTTEDWGEEPSSKPTVRSLYLLLFGGKESNVCARPMVLWFAECQAVLPE